MSEHNSDDLWEIWQDTYNDRCKTNEESLSSTLLQDNNGKKNTTYKILIGAIVVIICSIIGIIIYVYV